MDAAANPAEGSSANYLTDADYQAVLASRNSTEALANLIKAASQGVDLDAVIDAAEYSGNTRLLESVEVLKEFIADNTDDVGVTNFDSLRRQIANAEGTNPIYMTMKGGVAVRALMLDTANQIQELAGVSRQVDEAGGDAFRQQEMLLDRLEILAEMENSPKKCEFLTEKFEITPNDLDEKLSFLMQHEFVGKTGSDSQAEYSVDSEKLAKLMETAHNFENVDAGLAKMDGYLN